MKKVILKSLLIFICSPLISWAMTRCENGIIQVGNDKSTVLSKCGKPFYTESKMIDGVLLERWHIDIGRDYFIRVVTFERDRVIAATEDTKRKGNATIVAERNAERKDSEQGRYIVSYVKDGDTIVINETQNCRLYGIDAPEVAHNGKLAQSYGDEASSVLKNIVLNKAVDIKITAKDIYDRNICHVIYNGLDVNLEMIKLGYAWASSSEYRYAEQEARQARKGLWQQNNPERPSTYRQK